MNQIVKGLVFHYTTEQLAAHMRGRADHHDQRAAQKETAIPDLKNAIETVKKTAEASSAVMITKTSSHYNFNGENELERLETDIKDHKNKAVVFRELAEHLIVGAVYELGEADLRRLEVVK